MTPLTMTALTDAWRKIDHITVVDRDGTKHKGFPKRIERLQDGVVSITLGEWDHDGPTVQYRLIGDGETLEPVR
jgi:hypothetical protein